MRVKTQNFNLKKSSLLSFEAGNRSETCLEFRRREFLVGASALASVSALGGCKTTDAFVNLLESVFSLAQGLQEIVMFPETLYEALVEDTDDFLEHLASLSQGTKRPIGVVGAANFSSRWDSGVLKLSLYGPTVSFNLAKNASQADVLGLANNMPLLDEWGVPVSVPPESYGVTPVFLQKRLVVDANYLLVAESEEQKDAVLVTTV